MQRAPLLLVVAVVMATSGCGGDQAEESGVGQTLEAVRDAQPSAILLIYDLSQPVLGEPATYADNLPQDEWVVISACPGDAQSVLPVGVIPRSEYGRVEAEALAGEFDELLAECS